MRISVGSIHTLAANYLLLVARAGVALLLAFAIATADSLDDATLAGALGMFAVTDGAISTILWLRERRLSAAGLVGAIGVITGLAAMLLSENAHGLLLMVALRALAMGAVDIACARGMRADPSALWLLLSGGVSAVIGLGFGVVSLFGYDALDLHSCIAGQLGIVGALLLTYALKLRAAGQPRARDFEQARSR